MVQSAMTWELWLGFGGLGIAGALVVARWCWLLAKDYDEARADALAKARGEEPPHRTTDYEIGIHLLITMFYLAGLCAAFWAMEQGGALQ